MQTKLNAGEATMLAGFFFWLMGYRLLAHRRATGVAALAGLTLTAALLTMAGEAACYGLFTGIDPRRVLQANLVMIGGRPGWFVLEAGAAVTLGAALPAWARRASASRRSPT